MITQLKNRQERFNDSIKEQIIMELNSYSLCDLSFFDSFFSENGKRILCVLSVKKLKTIFLR